MSIINDRIRKNLPDCAIADPNLSLCEQKILAAILEKQKRYDVARKSRVVIMSNNELCRFAQISKRDLVFYRDELVEKGLIEYERGTGIGDASKYKVNWKALNEPIQAMKKFDFSALFSEDKNTSETPDGTLEYRIQNIENKKQNIKDKKKTITTTPTLTEETRLQTVPLPEEKRKETPTPTLTPTLTVEGNRTSQKRIVILKKEEEIPNYLLEIAEAIDSLELFDTWKKVLGDVEKEKNKDNLLKLQQVIDNFDFLDVESKESYKRMINRILNPTTTNNSNLGTVGLFEQEDDLPF